MRYSQGATALLLAASSVVVQGQECPPGYEKTKSITWEDCKIAGRPGLECGILKVPRDYAKPTGEQMELRLVRQPAEKGTKNPKSVIMNPGGPGQSGINQVIGKDFNGGENIQVGIGKNFHVIGFDPRGVGQSKLYKCPSIRGQPSQDSYFSDAGLRNALQYNQDQANECAKSEYSSDLVGTAITARDVNSIAQAVGEDGMIRYYGSSYGTLLGATVANMFPEKVDKFVLDGNINPTDYYYGLGDEQNADYDAAVKHFFAQCSAAGKPKCAVAGNNKESGETLRTNFDNFLKGLTIQQSYVVRYKLQQALYFRDQKAWNTYATMLSGWYSNKDSISIDVKRDLGDWKPAFDNAAEEPESEILDAITCGDVIERPKGASFAKFKEWRDLYVEKSKFKSKYGGDLAVRALFACSTWKSVAVDRPTRRFANINNANPILFINTIYDPVTPSESATNSSTAFAKSIVWKSTGVGHCTNVDNSETLNDAIYDYMQGKTDLPATGTTFKPDRANVFDPPLKKRAIGGPLVSRKPAVIPFFENRHARRAEPSVPAGCTKIAASSSPVLSASSSAVRSQSSSAVSASISSKASIISSSAAISSQPASISKSATPVASSSAISASRSASVISASSVSIAASSPAVSATSSVASSGIISASSAVSGAVSSSALVSSQGASASQAASVSGSASASIASASSVVSEPAQSLSSMAASISSDAISASSMPASIASVSGSTSILPINPSSVKIYGSAGVSTAPSYPASTPNGQAYYPNGASSSPAAYNNGYGSNSMSSANMGYGSAPAPTPTPYVPQIWASQPGCVPVTSVYTATTVQTITQCRRNEYCPLNPQTPTAVITKTETKTNVYAIPSTTVYVTKVVDVCSTGLTTSTVTVTQTCNSGCTTRPSVPTGWVETVKYCQACATPTSVTVTICTACVNKPSTAPGVKSTPAVTPYKPTSTPAGPTKPASVPVYNSQPAVPVNSKPVVSSQPAVPVYSKPSYPVGNNSTIVVVKSTPAAGTPAKGTPIATGGYTCSGSNCPTTTKSVLQFTGAAVREHVAPFVMPAVLAGFAFLF